MKILASGDHHFDQHSRFDECVSVHEWMVQLARQERVDLFVSGGDVYERASTPVEREAVASWLQTMADVCPVVIARGNHDRSLDVHLMRRLRSTHPIIVEERAQVHYVAGAAVAAVAWPEKRYLLARADSAQQANADLRGALQAVLRGVGVQLERHAGPRILAMHSLIDGSRVSTGQPLLGQPINVGLTDLALSRAHVGFHGHIHRAQCFDVDGAPHWYCGSPIRTDFGQVERKVVLLAEFSGDRLLGVREIETPARRMVHVEARWNGERMGYVTYDPCDNAEVRMRYRVRIDQREAARASAQSIRDDLLSAGAYSVQLEEQVIVETRERIPEVAQATTLSDKVEAFWTAKGFVPGARRDPLLSKLGELESESAA